MTELSRSSERDVKLALDDEAPLPPPGSLVGDDEIRVASDATFTLTAEYWDTSDLRLLRQGHTIRHRVSSDGSEDGWTLKLKAQRAGGATDGVARREELTVTGAYLQPPRDLSTLVAAFTRHEPLRPVATLVTTRRSLKLAEDGVEVLEVTDDRVASVVDGEPGAGFRELEIELRDPHRADLLDRVVQRLHDMGAGTLDSTAKVGKVLQDRLRAGEREAGAPDVGPRSTIGEVVRAAFAAAADRLMRHDPGVRLGDDVEAVHQARVATRRLRSDLKTLSPVLRPDRVNGLRSELAWLGGLLGAVRDADVLLGRLRARIDELPPEDRAGGQELLTRLAGERSDAYRILRDVLDGRRYVDLVDDLVAASSRPPFRPDVDPDDPAGPLAKEVAQRAWRRLAKDVRGLGDEPAEPELHEVRKRTKRARYAMELLSPVLGRSANTLAKRLASLQDQLGELQDAVVADQWLHSVAPSLPGRAAFVAGQLSEAEAEARRRARQGWRKLWRRAKAHFELD